jgi:uncharacterized protein (DUF305 family)
MRKALLSVVLGAILPFSLAAEEQAHGAGHGSADAPETCSDGTGMVMAMPPPGDAVVAAWQRINMEMHSAMSIDFTGDPDTDFMKGMIPHHQGAIDMANVLLEHGTDAETRALATAIIRAQEEEMALMQEWLAAHAE